MWKWTRLKSGKNWQGTIVPLALFVVVWELASVIAGNNNFPDILTTVKLAYGSFPHDAAIALAGPRPDGVWAHLLETFCYYSAGFLAGVFLGIGLSLLLFFNPALRKAASPLLEFIRIIPPLIVAPFLLLIFTTNPLAKLLIVLLYTSLSMNIFCLNAIDNMDSNYFYLIRLMRLSRRRAVRDIILPAMLPGITGGLRVNMSMSLGVLIVGEAIGPFNGLGKILNVTTQFNNAAYVFVCILWSVLIVLLFELVLYLFLKRKLRWKA